MGSVVIGGATVEVGKPAIAAVSSSLENNSDPMRNRDHSLASILGCYRRTTVTSAWSRSGSACPSRPKG